MRSNKANQGEKGNAPTEKEVKAPVAVVDNNPVIQWKKIGRGSLTFKHKMIKPGQVFSARVSEIPKTFRDVVVPTERLPEEPKAGNSIVTKQTPKVPVYKKVPHEFTDDEDEQDEPMFDIVNEKGKVLNQKPFTGKDADEFIKDLS